jgi:invasion protein IalB
MGTRARRAVRTSVRFDFSQVHLAGGGTNEGLQLMTYRFASVPAQSVDRTLAVIATPVMAKTAVTKKTVIGGTALALALAVSLAISFSAPAFAQTAPAAPAPAAKPKAAAPKKQPAKPAEAQQAPQPVPAAPGAPADGQPAPGGDQQQVQLIYSPWTKFCLKGKEANAKQVCFTGKDARIESGMPVIAAVIIEPEGVDKKILRVTLPLGMQLIHGTRVILDQNQPQTAPYVICFNNGCMADYEATAEMIGKMKKGQALVVQAINSNGQPISLGLPLSDFAKAYDGPPTDPKIFEEQQKKLQEELQRRADEARKKLESQGGAPTSSAAPPPAPGKAQ